MAVRDIDRSRCRCDLVVDEPVGVEIFEAGDIDRSAREVDQLVCRILVEVERCSLQQFGDSGLIDRDHRHVHPEVLDE